MKVARKRPLTLIEVCIAFGIIAVCFYIVFSNFQTSAKLIAKSEKASLSILKRQYLMQRLTAVFEKSETKSIAIEEKKEGAETIPYLTCVFENGLDRELTFSGIRKGEIEVIGNELKLTILAKDGEEKREEILIDHITDAVWDIDTPTVIKLELTDDQNQTLPFTFVTPRLADDKVSIEEEET